MASDGAAPPPPSKVARIYMPVSGLEVCLLDVGRFVALSGYAKACRRLAFVSRDFYGEDDYLVAGKLLTYGPKKRTRLMSLARKRDKRRVSLLLKVGANANAADTGGLTPLLLASGRGHAVVVDMLLRNGADVDAEDARGRTALHHATAGQHLDVVRLLLAWSADVNAADTDGRTALHLASISGHTEVVRLLLASEGIDIDAYDNREWTPLLHAERHHRHAVTAVLVDAGAVLDWFDENGNTVLGRAIARDDMESVRRLVALGAAVSGEYIFYLHEACAAGNVELVRLLLEREKDNKKRDLNYEDDDGWTPLHHAEHNGHHAVTAVLVEAGAYIDWRNESDGKSVLDWALDEGDEASVRRLVALGAMIVAPKSWGQFCAVPLHRTSAAGNVAMVELLIELGAEVEAMDYEGQTALLNAAHSGHIDVIEVLVEAGADVDWCDEEGNTALTLMIKRSDDADAIRRLVDLGAKLQTAGWQKSPLHTACRAGRVRAVRALLKLGADVDAREGYGRSGPTALHIACERGFTETARALIEGGARMTMRDRDGFSPLELAVRHKKAETAAVVEEAVKAKAAAGGV
jgi:uncharacterized protein